MTLSLRNGNLDDNTDNMDNTDNLNNQDNLNNLNNQDNQNKQGNQGDAETRSAKAVQQGGETNLTVYPNPTDDILYVELSGAGVQSAGLYDLQGRIVGANNYSPLQGTTATLSLKSVPSGVYLLRVTDTEGREYHRKIVKK